MKNAARFRKRTRGKHLTLLAACLVMTAGCGQSFQAQNGACDSSGACTNNSSGATGGGDSDTGSGSDAWKNLELEGSISGGRYAQTPVISLDKEKKLIKLKLPMPLPSPFLVLTREIAVPEIDGSTIAWESLADGSVAMVLAVPLDKYIKGLSFPTKSKLPNGDDLPGVAGGELPSVAVGLVPGRDITATIYLGPSTMAVFVNTPFDPFVRMPAIPIRDRTMTRTLGYFAIVPAVGDFEGGFYVSAALPEDIARIIDDIF